MAPSKLTEPEAWARVVKAHGRMQAAHEAALDAPMFSDARKVEARARIAFKLAEADWRRTLEPYGVEVVR